MPSKNIFKTASILLLVTLFSACGGGGGSGGTQDSKTATPQSATFIDDVVTGIKYVNGLNSGYTDASGKFPYTSGSVQFYIGNIKIGEVASIPADNKVFVQDLLGLPRTNTSDAKILKIATFIQSIDSNPATSQIEIPEATFKKFEETSGDILNVKVDEILEKSGFFALDTTKVRTHLQNTLVVQGEIKTTINQFKSSSINNNATNIDLKPTINLEYNSTLLLSLINSSNIYLKDSLGNNIPLSFDILDKVVKITPVSKLGFNKDYILSFRNKINLTGNDILGETFKTVSFKTKVQTDFTAPIFTNLNSPLLVNENQTSAFTLTATDESAVTYSLEGNDASSFDINSALGVVTFKVAPNYESKNIYNLKVIATDSSENKATKDVVINIKDLDENPPQITTASTLNFDENSKDNLTIQATDESVVTYSLEGTDVNNFNINSTNGVLTFKTTPDYETKSSYNITVVVTDSFGNKSTKNITININNISYKVSIEKVDEQISETKIAKFKIKLDKALDKDVLVTYTIGGSVSASDYQALETSNITIPKNEEEVILYIQTINDSIKESDENLQVTLTQVNGVDVEIDSSKNQDFIIIKDIENRYLKIYPEDEYQNLMGEFDTQKARAVAISNDGKKAFVADDEAGLTVLDISNPLDIKKISTFETGGNVSSIKLSSDNTKAYIVNASHSFKILNISNPENIITLKTFTEDGADFQEVELSSDGSTAYVSAGLGGVYVFSLTGDNIVKKSTFGGFDENDSYSRDLKFKNNKLYIARGNRGLLIYNVSNSSYPSRINEYNTDRYTYDVDISPDGTKAFLADDSGGVVILNISNENDISIINTFESTNISIGNITLSSDGNKAYVTSKISDESDEVGTSILALDISNLYNITELYSYKTDDNVNDIVISSNGEKIIVANDEAGIKIFDTTKEFKNINLSSSSNKLQFLETKNVIISIDYYNLYIYNNNQEVYRSGLYNVLDFYVTKDENKLYVLTKFNGIYVFNISNLLNIPAPQNINSESLSGSQSLSIFEEQNIVLVSSTAGIIKINLSDVTDITNVGLEGFFGNTKLSNDLSKLYFKKEGTFGWLDISDLNDISLGNSVDFEEISNFSVPSDEASNTNSFKINNYDSRAFYVKSNELNIVNLSNLSILSSYPLECGIDFELSNNENRIFVYDCEEGLVEYDFNENKVLNNIGSNIDGNRIYLSKDNSKMAIYSTTKASVNLKNLNETTLNLSKDFGSENIEFKIDTNFEDDINLQVTADKTTIISIGNYSNTLSNSDYKDEKKISIPINSIGNQTGKTLVTITISSATKTYTYKVWVNVYGNGINEVGGVL